MSPLNFYRKIPTVLDINPPSITVGTVTDQQIESGGNATFNVTASFTAGATGSLSYQWYNVSSTGVETPISGATTTSLVLTSQVDPANNNRRVRCYVSFVRGGTTAPAIVSPVQSNIATLRIKPFITLDSGFPTSQSVVAGNNVTFTASATVSSGGASSLTYQWYQNGVAIPGATLSTYQITNVPESLNRATYYCVVGQRITSAGALVADSRTTTTATLSVSPAIATVRIYPPRSTNGQLYDEAAARTYDLARGEVIPLLSGVAGGRWDFEAVDRDIYLNIEMKGTAGRRVTSGSSYDPGLGGEGQVEIFAKRGQRFTFKFGYGAWTNHGNYPSGCPGGGAGSADPAPLDVSCYQWNTQAPYPQYRSSDGGVLYAGGKKQLKTGGLISNYVSSFFSTNFDGGNFVVPSPQVCGIKYRLIFEVYPRFDKRTDAQRRANENSPGFDATFERRIYGTAIGEVRSLWERKTISWPSYDPTLPESSRPRRTFDFQGDHSWSPEWGTPRIEIWYIGNTIGDVGLAAVDKGQNISISPTADYTPDNYLEYKSIITTYSQVDGTDGGGGTYLYEGGTTLACVGSGGGSGPRGAGGHGGGFNQSGTSGGGPNAGEGATASGRPGKGGKRELAYTPYILPAGDYRGDLVRDPYQVGPFDPYGYSYQGARGGSGMPPMRCGPTIDLGLYCSKCECAVFDSNPSNAYLYEGRNNGGWGANGSGGGGSGFAGGGGGDNGSGGGGGSGFARPGLRVLRASTGTSTADYGEARITLSSRVPIPVNIPSIRFVNDLLPTASYTAGDIVRFVVNVEDTANFDPSITAFQYQWFVGGVQYSAAVSNTLRLRLYHSDNAKIIQCNVIGINSVGRREVLSTGCVLTVARSSTFTRVTPTLPTTANFTYSGDGQVSSTDGSSWDDLATHKIIANISAGKGKIRFSTRPNGLLPNIFGRKSNAPRGASCGSPLKGGSGISYTFDVRLAIIQNGVKIWSSHDRTFNLTKELTDDSDFSSSDGKQWDFDEIQDLNPNYPAQLVMQFKKSTYDTWTCNPANTGNYINQTPTSNYAAIAFKFGDFYWASSDVVYDYETGGAGDFTLVARDNIDPNS